MLKNYLKTAIRNIIRQKTFSLINISGLAIGMMCFIVISLWVFNELSFNNFHTQKERLFRVNSQTSDLDLVIYSSWRLGPALKEVYPEIEEFTRIWPFERSLVKYENKCFDETKFYLVDPAFFAMFTFPFIKGMAENALVNKNAIVITQETAYRYFGNENPIGKFLFVQKYDQNFKITGVIQNIPENSSMQFDLIARVDLMPQQRLESWEFTGFTSVLLKKNTDLKFVNNKIKNFYREHVNSESTASPILQPFTQVHLYEQGKPGLVKQIFFFSIVALFVLIIACINFMNLSTARATRRSKEIGVRKVIGAQRKQLIQQFLSESVIISFLALIIAILFAEVLLPYFNEITDRKLSLLDDQFSTTAFYLIVFTFITGLIAGSYPALFLSSFKPLKIIKAQNFSDPSRQKFRKGLTIFQFVISIGLIICTIVFQSQLHYVQNKNLGLNKDLVISFPINPEINKNFETYKHELLKNSSITNVTSAQNMPTNVGNFIGVNWEGHMNQDQITMAYTTTRFDFFKTFDIKFLYGRPFSEQIISDQKEAVIINVAAMKLMELNSPIGKEVYFNHPAFDESIKRTRIIGVVKDFHFRSLHNQIGPFIIRMYDPYQSFVFAKLKDANMLSSIEFIKDITKKFAPNYPFNFIFLDEYYKKQYEFEARIGRVFNFFAFLAIFVSCLGLFGLVSFNVNQRIKEIGIRKVLGASVSGIITMLCKEFTKWILIANVIAWPLAGFLMHRWLDNFVYKINVDWWIYLLAGVFALLIALITISFQAIKAALANPVDSLRYE